MYVCMYVCMYVYGILHVCICGNIGGDLKLAVWQIIKDCQIKCRTFVLQTRVSFHRLYYIHSVNLKYHQ